jgi:putative Ca2+/H+ antiporter (TMEM165/GDT1 family)
MGEAAWLKLPLKPLRIAIGTVFLIFGIVLALGALRLV